MLLSFVAFFPLKDIVNVLLYIAYKYSFLSVVFPKLYAGETVTFAVVAAKSFPLLVSILDAVVPTTAGLTVLSALYPIADHPSPDRFSTLAIGNSILDTVFESVFIYCVCVAVCAFALPW